MRQLYYKAADDMFKCANAKAILIIIIIIRNLYSAIMPLGGYRGAGGTGR